MQEIYNRVLAALVAKIREAVQSGQTQDEIAEICGTTQPTIQRILKGDRGENLPFKTILGISLGLDLDLAATISPVNYQEKEKIFHLLRELSKVLPAT